MSQFLKKLEETAMRDQNSDSYDEEEEKGETVGEL